MPLFSGRCCLDQLRSPTYIQQASSSYLPPTWLTRLHRLQVQCTIDVTEKLRRVGPPRAAIRPSTRFQIRVKKTPCWLKLSSVFLIELIHDDWCDSTSRYDFSGSLVCKITFRHRYIESVRPGGQEIVANENQTGLKGPKIMTNEGPPENHYQRKSAGLSSQRKIKNTMCPGATSYFIRDKQSITADDKKS